MENDDTNLHWQHCHYQGIQEDKTARPECITELNRLRHSGGKDEEDIGVRSRVGQWGEYRDIRKLGNEGKRKTEFVCERDLELTLLLWKWVK